MSGGEKKIELLKTICWQRVIENWDTCTQKKNKNLYNIFTTLSRQVLSLVVMSFYLWGKKVILVVGSN